MPQIKLGFNRVPVPSVSRFEPLYDIVRGVPLRDANNNPIVTELDVPISSLANADAATSVFINNPEQLPLEVAEVFAESSEVSTTLLGIPRAETQLSLFSDVSTYGLNPEEFEFYNFSGGTSPGGWYTRNNVTYGPHYYPRLEEKVEEQALAVEGYPVNFGFPRGPRFDNYNEEAYQRFVNFVILGNQYWNDYISGYPDFSENHFLDPAKVTVENGEVVYFVDEQDGYDLIEIWTLAWMDIRDGLLEDPKNPGELITFFEGFGADETRPGTGAGGGYGLLQSRKAYRYQPGRISGFTFGFRCSTDESSTANIIEWGIGNPTDQYVFQVRGTGFSIVRRSTVPLSNTVLRNQGLSPDDQVFTPSEEPIVDTSFWELVIPREKFNKDTLDSNGPSGYLLDPTKVTMYKIEFGWYGAIGAKFYAYIPTDYGGARWVLIHTLVIENQLGEPCLQDPNFKFRYSLNIKDTSSLRTPQFLYKYGASCYIDGGDNSAGKIYSYTSDENTVNANTYQPLLGILPKNTLSNTQGFEKPNKNNIFPSNLKVDSDQLTEIQVVEVEGCGAFGHHYAPSLRAGETGTIREITAIKNNGETIEISSDSPPFEPKDDDAKLITAGLFSTYMVYVNDFEADIKRIGFDGNYTKSTSGTIPEEVSVGGIVETSNLDLSAVRFTNYDAIAATDTPLTGDVIDVNFLNPVRRDNGQFAEFLIAVTEYKPILVEEEDEQGEFYEEVKFLLKDGVTEVDANLDDLLYEEFTQSGIGRNRDGFETGEVDNPRGIKMDLDYRIPRPQGEDSGICSSVRFTIEPRLGFEVAYTDTNPDTGSPGNFLIFENRPVELLDEFEIIGGELGIGETSTSASASGITFTSNVIDFVVDQVAGTLGYFVEIDSPPEQQNFVFWLSPISIRDRNKLTLDNGQSFLRRRIFSFEPKPLYLVIRMRDNAQVNNLTVTEFFTDSTRSFCPEYILNDKISLLPSGGSQPGVPAENFVSNDRLESSSIDNSLNQPLRPFTVKDTIYVAPNSVGEISLENIYGTDRTTITPGLLNTRATFFIGKSLEDNSLNLVNINVNTKEP